MDATPNGIIGDLPRSDSTTSLGKRKRDTATGEGAEDIVKVEEITTETEQRQLDGLFKDALDVLKTFDPTPSILNYPIPTRTSEEPTNKRARLSDGQTDGPKNPTIQSRIESGSYKVIDDLLSDVDTVLTLITRQYQPKDQLLNGLRCLGTQSGEDNYVSKASAFKKYVSNLFTHDAVRTVNKIDDDEQDDGLRPQRVAHENKTVLTFFGHAHNINPPRQVFSSLQKPKKVHLGPPGVGLTIEMFTPLREVALPNGIIPTSIASFNPPQQFDSKKKVPTFGETFAPPSSIATLKPPSQSRHTATRGSVIGFFHPDDLEPMSPNIQTSQGNRTNYKQSKIRVGQWLRYSNLNPPRQPSSPDAKRKPFDEAINATERAMSLFRRSYSSFGPTRDNSDSIVPEDLADGWWWKKHGERRFNECMMIQDAEDNVVSGEPTGQATNEDEQFEAAVRDWKPEPPPNGFGDDAEGASAEDERTTDKILEDISDLLETLSSYQRNRLLSLASSSPTPAGPHPMESSPTKPSSAESNTYEMLKESLASMIQVLPPYMVARLDGDQLKDLNVSTRISIESTNYRGTMEDDDYSIRMRESLNPVTAGAQPPTSNFSPNVVRNTYQTPASAVPYNQRPAYMSQPSASRPPQSYQQPPLNYPGRPMSSAQYSANPQQSYQNRPPPPATPRPAYPQSQYSQTGGSQYGPSSTPLPQKPVQNGYGHNSPPNVTAVPTSAQAYLQRPPPSYPQRSSESAYSSPLNARSTSPQKQSFYTPSPNQQRSSYAANANSTTQSRYVQSPHHPSQYGQYPPAKTLATPTNLTSYMTAAQQAILSDRGRQPIAEQQQRRDSGTPQPPNGQLGPGKSATPGREQSNGAASMNGQ